MSPEYVLPMSSENPVTYVPGWFESSGRARIAWK
jgi:hypothetical protein